VSRPREGSIPFNRNPAGVPRVPRFSRLLMPILLTLICSTPSPAASLMAGIAKTDITPPPGVPLWGFAARKTPSVGTLDPLFARILVLEVEEKRIALVTVDLGRTFGPASLRHLREEARKRSGISYLLLAATHTHSGPVILDEYPSGKTPDWESVAMERIVGSIGEAKNTAVDARLGTDYGAVVVTHNRRRVKPDGTVVMEARNHERIPTSPLDATVGILRVDTLDGKPLAVLVNYACHPVVLGPDNLQYSADFPAALSRTVEGSIPGQPLCFFLQGAPGDINPIYADTPLDKGGITMRDWTGEWLGREAVRVATSVRAEAATEPSLEFAEDLLAFSLRWDPEKWKHQLVASYGQQFVDSFAPPIQQDWHLPVATVLINKRIALMTMPGEPFVEFQIRWRERCPVRDAFFLGYANGYYGYFPTIKAASEGGYGASGPTTWVEPGAGERMVDQALVRVYQMLGKLSDSPHD
jgi:neutral/alkaline ceramidase-like enzyme